MEIMTIYYKDGFFDDADGGFVPEGAKEITEKTHRTLLEGQSAGKQIISNKKGEPVLVDAPPSAAHVLNLDTLKWEISPEKMTALLAERKTHLLNVIANKTDNFKAQYLIGYSQAEIDSFYRQEREARNELPTMLLTEIFEGRDDLSSIEDLKKKVIEKADLYAIIMGKLFAIKQVFEKHIEKAEEIEQLDKIEQEINKWQKL
jgi:raw score 9.21